MKEYKNFNWVAFIIVLLVIGGLVFVAKNNTVKKVPQITTSTPFMDMALECPDNTSVSDRYVCLYELAEKTETEATVLAQKLIIEAPIRLQEIKTTNTGPASFEYGGEDFLENLPVLVKNTEKAKGDYIQNICGLAQMNIFGGSGMDLEGEACRFHFTNQYLQILKKLEAGVKK